MNQGLPKTSRIAGEPGELFAPTTAPVHDCLFIFDLALFQLGVANGCGFVRDGASAMSNFDFSGIVYNPLRLQPSKNFCIRPREATLSGGPVIKKGAGVIF